jgi:hypothetical protein
MVGMLFPTYKTDYGGFGISIFSYLSSRSLEELKQHASKQAQEQQERQFILQWGDDFVLCGLSHRNMHYFKNRPVVARFAASGKETTPKKEEEKPCVTRPTDRRS